MRVQKSHLKNLNYMTVYNRVCNSNYEKKNLNLGVEEPATHITAWQCIIKFAVWYMSHMNNVWLLKDE